MLKLIENFDLKQEYFDHFSKLHGIPHVYRVMCNTLVIGVLISKQDAAVLAFYAAYVHDFSRKHDGKCSEHGRWAVEQKLPFFIIKFLKNGLERRDIPAIETAVSMHSVQEELPENDQFYLVTSILKDADALDRIRLGEGNLDISQLRFTESHSIIKKAKGFYYQSEKQKPRNFLAFADLAEKNYGIRIIIRN